MSTKWNEAHRRAETMCGVCHRIVGVMYTAWNNGGDGNRPPAVKITKHHDQEKHWCAGGGMAISPGAVIPKNAAAR